MAKSDRPAVSHPSFQICLSIHQIAVVHNIQHARNGASGKWHGTVGALVRLGRVVLAINPSDTSFNPQSDRLHGQSRLFSDYFAMNLGVAVVFPDSERGRGSLRSGCTLQCQQCQCWISSAESPTVNGSPVNEDHFRTFRRWILALFVRLNSGPKMGSTPVQVLVVHCIAHCQLELLFFIYIPTQIVHWKRVVFGFVGIKAF